MALFKCNCGYLKNLDDSKIGLKAKCPKCQSPGIVIDSNALNKDIKTENVENEKEIENNKTSEKSGFLKCPHCQKSFGIEDLNIGRGEISNIIQVFENSLTDNLPDFGARILNFFKKGRKNYLYILSSGILLTSIILIKVIFGNGINFSKTPSCTDSDVKKLVIEISNDEFKDGLLNKYIITELGTAPKMQGNPTYKYWNSIKHKDEDIIKIIELVDKEVKDANLDIAGIRNEGKNEQIKKCKCGAQLISEIGQSLPIQYTAQYTEDEQLYVNVFGLK